MRRTGTALLALGFAGFAAGALAQTGDPDRTRQQEALAHAVAIQNAWSSVEARIRVTDAANLWESEWTGLAAPPSGTWWLSSWSERGLTARYCDGVLAVYATEDELKGVGRGHREVQIAPVRFGGGRTGLHVILKNTRMARGAHGRDDTALPACMGIPATGEDRVGLVGAVVDPIRAVTGIRWETETRTVPCPGSATDTFREARQVPIQVTAVTDCPVGTPNCNDLSATASGAPHLWPRDCALRAGRGARAQCGPWRHAGGLCPFQYAQAPDPEPIPDPVIHWRPGPVNRTTSSCSCPAGEQGSCTLYYQQNTEYRDFQVRPGAPVVTTRRFARVNGDRRFVGRTDNCAPIPDPEPPRPLSKDPPQDPPRKPDDDSPDDDPDPVDPDPVDPDPGGPDGEGGGGEADSEAAEDDSANEGFGGSSMGPPGSMGNADTPGVQGDDNGDGEGGGGKPIVLDLDGDGVELVPLEDSTAFFDINGDGYRERMGWVSADDEFLAYDRDGDGRIAAHDELSFVSYVEGARTDLQGLRHFDTDGDGLLDPDDTDWVMFRVWQDLDQDGESDPGELRSLDEAGIRSVSLASDGVRRTVAGNTVFGEGEYVGRDGPKAFQDVSLSVGERKE